MISNNCKIEVTEEGENVLVKITSPIYDPLKTPRIRVGVRDVVDYLKDKGYPDVECIKGGTFSNRRATEENWIFSKKALDKPAEKVILSKEKKAAPKNKSKAKKKDK
jgi:hypothetical protein|tara:strand:+ start:1433 stop:1753 length:321 start_codon:yes stop_codon:yes gene_type:complete